MSRPDVWLRGPVPEVPALLQPVAHALRQAQEDMDRALDLLEPGDLWRRPGTAAPPGYHLVHLAGATDRLFTYARGEELSESQRAWLALERDASDGGNRTADELAGEVRRVLDRCLAQLRSTPIELLTTQRFIGRAQLPTNVLGCLYHAGEHAARHGGQLITTAKALRAPQ
jgi:hypothetical protein